MTIGRVRGHAGGLRWPLSTRKRWLEGANRSDRLTLVATSPDLVKVAGAQSRVRSGRGGEHDACGAVRITMERDLVFVTAMVRVQPALRRRQSGSGVMSAYTEYSYDDAFFAWSFSSWTVNDVGVARN
jgi:hypothetical protein